MFVRSIHHNGRHAVRRRTDEQVPTFRRLAMRQGRFQAGWMGSESTCDLQLRQSLLKFFHSGIGDLSAAEYEVRELCQPL